MPTIKIKRMVYDATDTFQTLKNFIILDNHGNLVIKDAKLAEAFDNMESNYNYNKELETKIQDLEKNIKDSAGLNTKNRDLKKEIQEKDEETSSLQERIKDFELEIQSLQDKNDTLNNTLQELQNNIESLQGERDELSKDIQKQEDIKTIFNRWGTYQSLMKDVGIVRFFMDRSDTDVRQKKVIEWFRNSMSKVTVRKHLYSLVKKKILRETDFKGTYRFNNSSFAMSRDMDTLAQSILGYGLFELAMEHHNKKLEDRDR